MICKKKKEWENIENAFNARHGVNTRSITQLKSLWKNLKARAKADVAKERRDRRKTGGGPMEKNTDNISNAISEMIPQQINSLENAFDDDASFHGDELEKENEADSDDDRTSATGK
ncbi:myb/SANT-like DNA-binding domain-containing protein 3 [Ostrea edulis]|uniref:myb/SANT-like DNA-binding domain-containing protein 3 n=1 Tax=Ostrea edulis TaxID=37623 RepID=UPI0024AEF9C8|nr:myb/SANT-like DNA-binding domain-containing protein 3 [Ostrea edulis]